MRYSLPVCFFILFSLASCIKEEEIKRDDVFVNTIISNNDVATVGSINMSDGNMLIVGRRIDNKSPGFMVKINSNGDVIWTKSVSPLNQYLWKVIAIPGTGFATLGISTIGDTYMSVCIYNNDGNSLSEKRINTNYSTANEQSPYEIIMLSNGNFAVAGSSTGFWPSVNGYLKILDHDFNLLHSKAFFAPDNYRDFNILGLTEIPDGSIAITASTSYNCTCDTAITNTILLKTDLTGSVKSVCLMKDWANNETPNAVAAFSGGSFALTSKISAGNIVNGSIVDYYSRSSFSGRIFINQFNPAGQYTGNTEIAGFPGNGLTNSLRSTNDGGYILCGTVNTFNSPYLISQTKIFLCKIDAALNLQWTKVFETAYQAIGVDALQTQDGGYLVSGHHKSFKDHFEMILIKTDANGNY